MSVPMTALEDMLAFQLDALGVPYTREFRAIPGRRFRWDFLIGNSDKSRLLVEVQGGTWARERYGHSTGAGISRDYAKSNCAQMQGWRTLMFDSKMVKSGEAARIIQEAYERQNS